MDTMLLAKKNAIKPHYTKPQNLFVQCSVVCFCALLVSTWSLADDRDFFETRVRPVLATYCYECHGPGKQKSELRLDHISTILKGGERGAAAVKPGDPETSLMIQAIRYTDPKLQMPPTGMLPEAHIADLTAWVAAGAYWPEEPAPKGNAPVEVFDLEARRKAHWAWQAVSPQTPPPVEHAEWPATPVDAFILARLEAEGLTPAAAAAPATVLRRMSFDLSGLPPTPEEIEAFLDEGPDAHGKALDRLLDSPRFGERWARHWFDCVRFAETYGHEQDYPIKHAWQYRDYVIRALNADVPYDQFAREHIAGDLMEEPRRNPEQGFNESVIGTGFWFMHQATHAPVDVRQDEADRIDNQIDVFSKTFLGMTVSCARCHEHKFDAISTADYYALTGFLRSSRQDFAFLDPGDRIAKVKAKLEMVHEEGGVRLRAAMDKDAEAAGEAVSRALLAVNEVLHGNPNEGIEEAPTFKILADFEDGDYEGWETEGEAFSREPLAGDSLPEFMRRAQFGAYSGGSVQGDGKKGALRSPVFTIDQPYLQFVLAAGLATQEVAIVLHIGDEEILKVSPAAANTPQYTVWDLGDHLGEDGRIEVLDLSTHPEGYLLIDNLALSGEPVPGSAAQAIAPVATKHGIAPERLSQWITLLRQAELRSVGHPLGLWLDLIEARSRQAEIPYSAFLAAFLGGLVERGLAEAPAPFDVYESFDGPVLDGWMSSGAAFDGTATGVGEWEAGAEGPRIALPSIVHSGLLSRRLQGVLRSPNFIIEHENIHYHIAGAGGRIRVVIGQYQLCEYNGLLFGQSLFDVNTDGEFVWHNQTKDLRRHLGQEAYIEIIDEGDGFIAVDEIRFSDGPPPGPAISPWVSNLVQAASEGCVRTLEATAGFIGGIVTSSMQRWAASGTVAPAEAALLDELLAQGLLLPGENLAPLVQLAQEKTEAEAALAASMRVLAITDGPAQEAQVLIRGNYTTPGEKVPRRFLEALAGGESPITDPGSGRRALADQVVSNKNPLFARVAVNRVWSHLFGEGLVPSVDNFGVLGEKPSHPELLDHLATWFEEHGYSVKALIRYLMQSNTYKMSSSITDPAAELKDPDNTLLHRMPVRRLEGEVIRDSILYAAGMLDETMYGVSVPIYLSPFMGFSRRPAVSGPEDGNRRRSIYIEIRRNFLSPMMLAFDMPIPDTTRGHRPVSNIPSQSLILMNDAFISDQARAWGARLAEEAGTNVEARLQKLYMTALGRLANPEELARAQAFLLQQAKDNGLPDAEVPGAAKLWADLCHVMFMLKEFIYIS